ncbi:MAG: hypothetical protein E7632_11730 [Ruminococcaceae bacterium]|nr:hypothetical protein [Oscillospiraceae bacterium]
MKKAKLFAGMLALFVILQTASCDLAAILPVVITDSTAVTESTEPPAAESTEPAETTRFSVEFDENETFATDEARRASEHIDGAIIDAVKLLNTVDEPPIHILDCDYDARPKMRDSLKDPISKEMYDRMKDAVTAFGDYRFSGADYPGKDLFNLVISAVDALRTDHTELFLYCDCKIVGEEYFSCYYMPGDWLGVPSDDRQKIRKEAAFCDAVAARIIEKMPEGLTNYQKCCYFAFVLAAANEYDHSMTDPVNDYQAYYAFTQGKAICSGYAQAFYRLCREAGISCWYCRGVTPAGRHAWNMLDTEDGPIYLDVTWYDTPDIREDWKDGKEAYLFMTQEDFDYYGYVQEFCQ